MASNAHSTPAPAMQPELRSYIVYSELPANSLAHIVAETTCPHFRAGEIAVVDREDREIATGDLFVLESGRGSPNGPTRSLVEFKQHERNLIGADGEAVPTLCWMAHFYGEIMSVDGSHHAAVRWTDGPVRLTKPEYFTNRLVGRVVGILEPSFSEPMRAIG